METRTGMSVLVSALLFIILQIQDCANHFQIAYQQLQFIQDTQQALKTPSQLSRAFYELNTNLRKAEEVLVVPRLPSMAEIYSAEQRVRERTREEREVLFVPCYLQSHFKPELPEDTFVHFHINCSQLVLTIFSVTQTNKQSTSMVRNFFALKKSYLFFFSGQGWIREFISNRIDIVSDDSYAVVVVYPSP